MRPSIQPRHCLLIALLLSVINESVLAQAQTRSSALATKHTLGLYGRADLGYRTLSASAEFQSIRGVTAGDDSPALLPAVELRYTRRLNERRALSVGAGYSVMGWNIDTRKSGLTWGSQWNGTELDPTIDPGEPAFDVPSGYRLHYLTVPVTYVYRLCAKDGGLSLSIGAGLEPGYLRATRMKYETPDGRQIRGSLAGPVRSFVLSATGMASLSYPIREHVALSLSPTFRHQLTALNDGGVRHRAWTAGLAAGVVVEL